MHRHTAETVTARPREGGFAATAVEHLGWGLSGSHWDGRLRGYKLLDGAFEWLGRRLVPWRTSSLYLIARYAP